MAIASWPTLSLLESPTGATGSPDALGAEYVYARDGETSTYGLGRWNGSGFDFSTSPSADRHTHAVA